MGRLYGRSSDVYNVSKYLLDKKLEKYNQDKTKTSLYDIGLSASSIKVYLPDKAVEIITNTPIVLSRAMFIREPLTFMPYDKEGEPIIYFPKNRVIKEFQNDFIFFIGRVLAAYSPDKMPDNFSIPCEYHDVIPFLLNYLYQKENGNENNFSLKYLHELLDNAKSFVKVYDSYNKFLDAKNEERIFGSSDKIKKYDESNMKAILYKTLQSLVPLSSMDATLQIIDKYNDQDDYKKIIEELVINPNNNREEILMDKGIETFGFKRLIKEIDKKRVGWVYE